MNVRDVHDGKEICLQGMCDKRVFEHSLGKAEHVCGMRIPKTAPLHA